MYKRQEVYKEKNLCIKYLKHQIDRDKLIKRLKIVKQVNPSSICESILNTNTYLKKCIFFLKILNFLFFYFPYS